MRVCGTRKWPILPCLWKQRGVKMLTNFWSHSFYFFRRNSNSSFIRFRRSNFSDHWCTSSLNYRNAEFWLSQRCHVIFIQQMRYKNWHKKGYTGKKTYQPFRTKLETFKVRRENKLPAWFLFSVVNLNSAYKQISCSFWLVFDKNVVTTFINGSCILKALIWTEIRHNLHISLPSHLKQVNWKHLYEKKRF